LLASIFGCFNDLRDYKWSKYELSELCFQAERIVFKQKGGWQDQYATVFGGFNFIELSKQKNIVNQLKIPKQMQNQLETFIYLIDTKKVHNSGDIHNSNYRKPSKELNKDISNLYSNAYEMKDYLSKMDFINFNEQVNRNWLFKKTLSNKVSLKKIDNIIKEGLKNGALSSKLLGSGQGGYIFFIINPNKIKQFIEWIKKNNFKQIKIKFDENGLSVWRSNEKSILY
jgi:D-glycero-alpha-D-manno-heptose-7-phosphate kinase